MLQLHGRRPWFDLTKPPLGESPSFGEIPVPRTLFALQEYGSEPHVLFLDEPTASLPAAEVSQLYDVVRAVQRRGVAVVYISHHFNEVFDIADRVTVLRDARIVGTYATSALDEDKLIELTLGRELRMHDVRETERRPNREVVLSVRGLWGNVLRGIDFDVHASEVVGVAGVTGSGREEIAPLVFGALPRVGDVTLDGIALPSARPDIALRRGMALVPANRHANAALADMSLRENTTLGWLKPYARATGLNLRRERRDVGEWLERLSVKPAFPDVLLATLSGGNQQKVMLARALRREPRVIVLDEPTQGVDVGAKAAIHSIVDRTAAAGAGVLVVATESEDLVRLCDRILVVAGGRILAELDGRSVTADEVTELTLARHRVGASS